MNNYLTTILLIILAPAISSCATSPTPYQPLGESGGYKSKKNPDNSYELLYVGNIQVNIETVKKYWLQRASELCGKKNYTHRITNEEKLITEKQSSGVITIKKLIQPPSITGIITCN